MTSPTSTGRTRPACCWRSPPRPPRSGRRRRWPLRPGSSGSPPAAGHGPWWWPAWAGRASPVPCWPRWPAPVVRSRSSPIVAGDRLGLLAVPVEVFEATARRLELAATSCRPANETFINPAKTLALDVAGSLPMVWGSSMLAGTAAYRMVCQLAENAKQAAVFGQLPEAAHNQVIAFDGPYADGRAVAGTAAELNFLRDRAEDVGEHPRLRLVLLRDVPAAEHPQVARRAAVSRELAEDRGIPVTELVAGI